jgi:hypothetical protein
MDRYFFVPGLTPQGPAGSEYVDVRMVFTEYTPLRFIAASETNVLASVHKDSIWAVDDDDLRYRQFQWRITWVESEQGYDIINTDNSNYSLAQFYSTTASTTGIPFALSTITNKYFDIESATSGTSTVYNVYRIKSKEHGTYLSFSDLWSTTDTYQANPGNDAYGALDPIIFESLLTSNAEKQHIQFTSTTSPYDVYAISEIPPSTLQLFESKQPSATGNYEFTIWSYAAPTCYVQQKKLTHATLGDHKWMLGIDNTWSGSSDYSIDTWKFQWSTGYSKFTIYTSDLDITPNEDVFLGRLKQPDGEFSIRGDGPQTNPGPSLPNNYYQDNTRSYSDMFDVEYVTTAGDDKVFKISQTGSSLKAESSASSAIKHMIFDVSPTSNDLTSPNDEFWFILKNADGTSIDWG